MTTPLDCSTESVNSPEVEALYPAGSVPENRIPKISAKCSFGDTPRLITGIIRQILLQHFVDSNHIANAYLRDFLEREGVWSEGPESGIYIEALSRWKPESTEARPAVLIKEGDWQWRRMVINDLADRDWRSGTDSYLGFWAGTHTIFVLGNEGAETQLFSAEIAKLLVYYGSLIGDQMNLYRWVPVSLGSLRALKESTENYVVPITFAYVAEEAWKQIPDAPRLKRIVLKTSELELG